MPDQARQEVQKRREGGGVNIARQAAVHKHRLPGMGGRGCIG